MNGQRGQPARRVRHLRGKQRVLAHILIFAILGAILLGAGTYGRQRLFLRAREMEAVVRVDTLLDAGTQELRQALLQVSSDGSFGRDVSAGISSRKRALKEQIAQMVQADTPDSDIAGYAIFDMLTGVLNRLDDENRKDAVRDAVAGARVDMVSRTAQAADAAVLDLSPAAVRVTLPVTEPFYPLMYYHAALFFAGGFLLAFAIALLYVYLRYSKEKRERVGELLEPMDYLLPFFLGVLLFTLYPIVRVVIMSFQERYRLEGSFAGWGLGNYDYVLRGIPGTSNYFLQGLRNTLLYVLFTVPLATVLAIVIAYLLNQKLRFSALFQTTYFLPMVTSVTAVGLVWRWIFNRNFGILNAILVLFGLTPVDWLQQASNSMAVLVIFGVWSSLPFTIILLLSGLQNIDETYYTVARVDGARAFRIFRRITVPLLAPTIGLVLIINSISAFKVFTEVKVLFNGYPGPVKNLYTVVYYIYDMMYENRELGRAAAAAIVLFVFIFAFTMLQRYIQRKWKYD